MHVTCVSMPNSKDFIICYINKTDVNVIYVKMPKIIKNSIYWVDDEKEYKNIVDLCTFIYCQCFGHE